MFYSFKSQHVLLASLFVFCVTTSSSSFAENIVVPNSNTSAGATGNNRFPLLVNGGMRYQQVYDSSQFNFLASGGEFIAGISFRTPTSVVIGGAFGPTEIENIIFNLSTTNAVPDGLSASFADNIGRDNSTVFSGTLTIGSNFTAGAGGTRAFDIFVDFQNPFFYNPANGNLLLDITNSDMANNNIGIFFEAADQLGDSVSRAFSSERFPEANIATNVDSLGLVTQFSTATVPEPSLFVLMLGMGMATLARRKKRTSIST